MDGFDILVGRSSRFVVGAAVIPVLKLSKVMKMEDLLLFRIGIEMPFEQSMKAVGKVHGRFESK